MMIVIGGGWSCFPDFFFLVILSIGGLLVRIVISLWVCGGT